MQSSTSSISLSILLSIYLYISFMNLQVNLFYTPPHTTQLLQPLDVGVFGPLKQKFRSICATANLSGSALVNRANFPGIWRLAIQEACSVRLVREAFADSGISPFDPLAIDRSSLKKAANVQGYFY